MKKEFVMLALLISGVFFMGFVVGQEDEKVKIDCGTEDTPTDVEVSGTGNAESEYLVSDPRQIGYYLRAVESECEYEAIHDLLGKFAKCNNEDCKKEVNDHCYIATSPEEYEKLKDQVVIDYSGFVPNSDVYGFDAKATCHIDYEGTISAYCGPCCGDGKVNGNGEECDPGKMDSTFDERCAEKLEEEFAKCNSQCICEEYDIQEIQRNTGRGGIPNQQLKKSPLIPTCTSYGC